MTLVSDIDLSTEVAGIPFSTCLYNASGPRSGTVEALKRVAASSGTGAVLSKSATVQSQAGNPQPRIYHDDLTGTSYNSEGLPNQGIDYYIQAEHIQEITSSTSSTDASSPASDNKPYIVSLSGKTLEENLVMLDKIAKCPALSQIAALELNLACPNIIGKPILAYDLEQITTVLQRIQQTFPPPHFQPRNDINNKVSGSKQYLPPLGVKLPPYLDMIQLKQVADILNQFNGDGSTGRGPSLLLSYVTTMNTMGNALPMDLTVQQPYIAANAGLAGMSGRALKSHALANVRQFRQALSPTLDIVGVGGVETGNDVIALLLAGAKAVQIGTTHWKEGPGCFDRIAQETKQWLHDHGYTHVSQVYNQLQPWSKERANQARQLKKQQQGQGQQVAMQKGGFSSSISSTMSQSSSAAQFWKLVSAILAVLVAILLADKWHSQCYPSALNQIMAK